MSAGRIAVVTLGLAAAAAVAGGIVGALMMSCWLIVLDEAVWNWEGVFFGGVFGGVVGAILGPSAAWLLMRHVPLGVAIGGTALGTLAGAIAGLVLGGPPGSFYGAFVGFGAAAVAVRVRTPRERRIAAPAGPGALP